MVKNFNPLLKFLFVFHIFTLGLLTQSSNGQIPEYQNVNVCYSKWSEKDIVEAGSHFNSYAYLTNFKNCTHIQGSLIISDLAPLPNGGDPDLSMLHAIREISGYLYIRNVSVSKLEFPNLVVIRGKELLQLYSYQQVSLAVVNNSFLNLYEDQVKGVLQTLSMPKLTSIQRGDVVTLNNAGLCFFPHNIQWQYIFDKPSDWHLIDLQEGIHQHSWCDYTAKHANEKFECHSDCPLLPNKKQGCYGKKEEQCQRNSKCVHRQCGQENRCFLTSDQVEECCSELCSGGCSAAGTQNCFACNALLDGGDCVNACPKRYESNVWQSKFQVGNVCVKECPKSFYLNENDRTCVQECPSDKPLAKNGTCSTCSGNDCPRKCDLFDIINRLNLNSMVLNGALLKELDNCTHVVGDILITDETFTESNETVAVESMEEFNALKSLREISGSLHINTSANYDFVKNLSFLRNLEKIHGENYGNLGIKFPLEVINSGIEYLGLRNLQDVTISNIFFQNLSNICYLPELLTNENVNGKTKLKEFKKFKDVKKPKDCLSENKKCDKNCDEKSGCWGPGADLCLACRQLSVDGICVEKCTDVAGYYFNNQTQNCDNCHEQCNKTCTGKSDFECLGVCKNAKDSGRCVGQCSLNRFPDAKTRYCLSCNAKCKKGCSGPNANQCLTGSASSGLFNINMGLVFLGLAAIWRVMA